VPAILDQLNHLSVPYRWVTRFLPLDQTEAEAILKNYKRQWFAKRKGLFSLLSETLSKRESAMMDTAAVGKAQDADAALQTLAAIPAPGHGLYHSPSLIGCAVVALSSFSISAANS
jgi:type IV secretion system protein VirB4